MNEQINDYPRETVEFQPVPVEVDGVAVLTGVTFSVVASGQRPGTYSAPTVLGGALGVMVTGLAPGYWQVFAKVVSSPETVVIDCGYFIVS